jgi:hypothetical protein
MKRTCILVVESCKVEGKLLITLWIMRIMWNAHKEFHIHTSNNILLSSSNWMGHELKKPLLPPCQA